jgi:hypothetical protein
MENAVIAILYKDFAITKINPLIVFEFKPANHNDGNIIGAFVYSFLSFVITSHLLSFPLKIYPTI